jgi:hypothetical protein
MKRIIRKFQEEITLTSLKGRTEELVRNKSDSRRARFGIILLISIASVLSVIFLALCYEIQDPESMNYILSSISQGLAAIFALVFTIMLVTTQILSKYSVRATSLIFSSWTVFMMFIFAGGIIGPLLVMKWQSEQLLDLCIMWAGACIFLLIPYFLNLKKRLSPEWHIESFLQKVDSSYIEQLKSLHEMRASQSRKYLSYESNRTGGKYWFDVPDDPLLVFQQIMIRTLREGDYKTFISALISIRKRYQTIVNEDNSRYVGFQFISTLTRLGKEIIKENQDFLLLRLCFTLRDIAVYNANQKLSGINDRIAFLMGEYLEIAYIQKDFIDISFEVQEIIKDICTEYVKSGSKIDFSNLVGELGQRGEKIAKNVSPEGINQFLIFIRFLTAIALTGGLAYLEIFESLAMCIRDVGIESVRRSLRLSHRDPEIESRLGEWSAIHLERMIDDLRSIEDKIGGDKNHEKRISILKETISKIGIYASEVRDYTS